MKIYKTNTVSVLALVLSGAFAVPLTASAQEQAPPDNAELSGNGEITVTARRVNERLVDVPASISVLTSDTLSNTGAKIAADFVQLTPGVTIVAGNVEAADTQINIRGLNGARDAESNVALVVDGILKTNTSSLNQDQGAVSQVEVLKGPQGALYGRNAAAGAIVITTAKPTDVLSGSLKASYGNNQTATAAALLSGPITDRIGFVLNGDYARSDGFYRNAFLPTAAGEAVYPGVTHKAARMDNYEKYNINARIFAELGEATQLDTKLRYGKQVSGAILFNAAFQIPDLAAAFGPDFNIDVNKHKFIFSPNVPPKNRQTTFEASTRLETDLGFATLSAYGAYNDIKNYLYADGTSGTFGFFDGEPTCQATMAALAGTPVQSPFGIGGGAFLPAYSPTTCDGTQFQQRNQRDFSTEIRLIGDTDRLSWQIGAYYLWIKRDVCLNLGLDTGVGVIPECFTTDPRNPTESLADDTFRTNVYAGFGSLDWKPVDRVKIGLALRYDVEQRDVSNNIPTDARTRWVGNVLTGFPNGTATTPANYYLNPSLDPAYNPSGVLAPRHATFKQLQPKVTFSFKPTPDINLFANWGVGFKSGGFNASGSETIIDQLFNNQFNAGLSISDQYNKERSSSFEAGLKWQSPDRRMSLELAAYRTDVHDMQFFEFFVGPFGLLRVVSNIDKVRLQGFEAAANATIVPGWTVFASGNVTDSNIKRNNARPYTVGNKSPYTADYTLNAGTQMEIPTQAGFDLFFRADYRLTGPTWFHTVQNNSVPNIFGLTGNFTNSQRDAYSTVNLRAGLKAENWSIMAFANNFFGQKYVGEVIPAPEFGGDFLSPGSRAYYGMELSYKF